MRERQRHRGQALGGRVDDRHGALLPRLSGLSASNTAPEVDDLLAAMIGTAGAAELVPVREVVGEGLADGFEPATDASLYLLRCDQRHGSSSVGGDLVLAGPRKGK